MLCVNIYPNLNISGLVIDRVNTDIKISNNTKMNCVYPFQTITAIFIDRVPYKHKTWQFHGILLIPFQISLFSPHIHNVTFST